jgi:hypothetical protein
MLSETNRILLQNLAKAANVSEDQLLLQLISNTLIPNQPSAGETKPSTPPMRGGSLRIRGEASLPAGLRLRKIFKGQERRAAVERDGIRVEGMNGLAFSPSIAAVGVTGYNTNGWTFWEYCDERTQTWKPLNDFRRDMGLVGYRIDAYDPSLGAELGICNEWKDGPSRHAAEYVVSHPAWRQPRAFCEEHLNKLVDEDQNLKGIWERVRAHKAFFGK